MSEDKRRAAFDKVMADKAGKREEAQEGASERAEEVTQAKATEERQAEADDREKGIRAVLEQDGWSARRIERALAAAKDDPDEKADLETTLERAKARQRRVAMTYQRASELERQKDETGKAQPETAKAEPVEDDDDSEGAGADEARDGLAAELRALRAEIQAMRNAQGLPPEVAAAEAKFSQERARLIEQGFGEVRDDAVWRDFREMFSGVAKVPLWASRDTSEVMDFVAREAFGPRHSAPSSASSTKDSEKKPADRPAHAGAGNGRVSPEATMTPDEKRRAAWDHLRENRGDVAGARKAGNLPPLPRRPLSSRMR